MLAGLAAALPVARLLTALPAPPVMTAAEWNVRPESVRLTAAASVQPKAAEASANLLRPNAAGALDLTSALNTVQAQADQARPANPFRLRYHPPLLSHTVSVAIEAVVLGASAEQDCCVLNRQPLHRRETFEGLVVAQISPDEIVLQRGAYLLALPVGEQTFTLQLPAG